MHTRSQCPHTVVQPVFQIGSTTKDKIFSSNLLKNEYTLVCQPTYIQYIHDTYIHTSDSCSKGKRQVQTRSGKIRLIVHNVSHMLKVVCARGK